MLKTDGGARLGKLTLPGHAPIETPNLLLYTQKGSGLSLTPDLLAKLPPTSGLMVDAMHFLQFPSPDMVQRHGGMRSMLSAPADMLLVATARDSVAYEYSGRSNRDGETYVKTHWGHTEVSPARYVQTIAALQPDLWTGLADEVAASATHKRARASVSRTARWLDACLAAQQAAGIPAPMLAPIAGAAHPDERARSAREAATRAGIAGFALTGFGTGETREQQADALSAATAELPADKPRLLQGVGAPDAVLSAVERGIDLFDSGYAHRATAAGAALTFQLDGALHSSTSMADRCDGNGSDVGLAVRAASPPDHGSDSSAAAANAAAVDLWDTRHRASRQPLLSGCSCYTCRTHTRAYIHHMLQTKELLGLVLLDLHNCHHMLRFFADIRGAIEAGQLAALSECVLASVQLGGLPPEHQTLSPEILSGFVAPTAAVVA